MRANAHANLVLALALLIAGAPTVHSEPAPPPDLRLEWLVDGRAQRTAPAIEGRAGDSVELDYLLRNVGGSPAYAAIVEAFTALGPVGDAKRIQPGPRAGEELRRSLTLPLARGARELCLVVRLQTLEAESPNDPQPADNRLCRAVRVTPRDDRGAVSSAGRTTDDTARSLRPVGEANGLNYSATQGDDR